MTPSTHRVRIAPSPTGGLHVGTARTALFNCAYALNVGGAFVLRIEDTDTNRSEKKWEQDILQGLEWLGIQWDEGVMSDGSQKGEYGPYRQSERREIYATFLQKLLRNNGAFYCWHTKQELQNEQRLQMQKKEPPRHLCSYRDSTTAPKGQSENGIIRLRNDAVDPIIFSDAIRGEVRFQPQLLGDFSIARSENDPLYNFAVVVDDHAMKITDVIRGEDHISNTPKQYLLQKALGIEHPQYAHVPLLLGTDRSKLSKRHGTTSINEYRTQGYIADALFNFLALLGWRPQGDQEIMSRQEIVELFSLQNVQTSPAIFDTTKLDWMNGVYIRNLSKQEFAVHALPYLNVPQKTLSQYSQEQIETILGLEQERIKTLQEIQEGISFMFELPEYEPSLLWYKESRGEQTQKVLRSLFDQLSLIPEHQWSTAALKALLTESAEKADNKGAIFHPVRVAVSGRRSSPPPFDIMSALGKQESIRRIQVALNKLSRQQL